MTEQDPEIQRMLALSKLTTTTEENAASASLVQFGNLTDRERKLVREASVMGFFLGVNAVPGGEDRRDLIPSDSEVVNRVLATCRHYADLYPTLASIPTYTVQKVQTHVQNRNQRRNKRKRGWFG